VGNATGFFNSMFANTYVGVSVVTTGTIKTGVYTSGTIVSAVTAGEGARAFVTDAVSTTFGNIYTGGSTNKVPVYSDGAAWYIG
jgi:hypothetical protein